jgi:ELWxxDGT repeat protein
VAGEEPYLAYPQINSIKMIRDLYPGSSSAGGSYPCRLGNEVLFAASGYLNYVLTGRELYVTDGTSQGTRLLKDIRPGTSSSSPSHLTRWRGKIYFGANDGTHGSELWVSDGTAAGTTLLKDINPGSANGSPYSFAATDKLLFFRANGGTSTGYELWKTDGTAAGTQLVKDINPGSESSYAGELEAYGDSVYFSAKLASTGFELWKSDGTAAGTVLVKDIQPGSADGDPEHLVVWQGLLWFRADDGVHGEELWVSDGSSAGTRLFADIWPGATSSGVGYLTPCGSRHLYFRADDGTGKGIELWRSDGTVAGTQLATEIRPGPAGANPYLDYSEGSQSRFLVLWGDVIFGADDGLHARELWKYRNGATAQAIGEGFAPHTRALPTLRSEDPLLGATINVEGSLSSGPNSVAITLFGIPDYSPMRLLPSEDAWSYLDLGLPFWVWNVSAANAQKRFSFQVGIPNDPHLMGLRTVLQSWVLGTDGPRGFDLSNGVSWWIGT